MMILQTLNDLEKFFKEFDLPGELRLNKSEYIFDLKKSIERNIRYLKAHQGNKGYLPYYYNLVEIKKALIKTKKK